LLVFCCKQITFAIHLYNPTWRHVAWSNCKACDAFQAYGCGGGVLVAGMGGVAGATGAAGAAGAAGASLALLGAEPVEPLSELGLQPNNAPTAINIRMVALIFIVLLLFYGLSVGSVLLVWRPHPDNAADRNRNAIRVHSSARITPLAGSVPR